MNPQELGRQVFQRRRNLGISQSLWQKKLDISRNYVSLIERGEVVNVSLSIVGRLAEALGTTTAALTGEAEKPNILVPPSLRDFSLADGLSFATVVQLINIPRRGKEPQSAEDWRRLYNAVREYLDDDEEE